MNTLSWKSLSHSYQKTQEISFPDGSLNRGESLAVIGSSGTGKSTWMQLLCGIIPVQSGSVHYDDHNLADCSSKLRDKLRAENLGVVFQKNHFLENLSIQDNLSLPAYAQRKSCDDEFITVLCKDLNVDHLLKRKPRDCSVGELQRLSIVRAMTTHPAFIIADEPTSALDDVNAKAILDIFEHLRSAQNVGIIVVTHDQRVKAQFTNTLSFS